MVENVPSIKDECGLDHTVVDPLVVQILEQVPLGHHRDGVAVLAAFVRVCSADNMFL